MGADDVEASEVSGERIVATVRLDADVDPAVDAAGIAVPAPRRSTSTRDRLIDAAVVLTTAGGWAAVTMSKLAQRAGVSRQTVYNEIGTKADLAEAMILRESQRFVGAVTRAFEEREDDLPGAIRAASYEALARAEGNQLLHAIVSATHGADTELLPLLTSRSHGLLGITRELIRERVETFDHGLAPADVTTLIDVVVRVVLSHVMQPSGTPEEIADRVAWLTDRVLRART